MFESVMTIGDQIYKVLRREIIEMRIKPGEKLSEAQVAERFNVSRSPVRDAIRRLQQEKLVLVKPQIGTIVSQIVPDQAREICEVRLLLEPHAAFVATSRIADTDLALLKVAFDRIQSLADEREEKRLLIVQTDNNLHRTIWLFCNNREIENILDRYLDRMRRIQLATIEIANRLPPSEHEMRQIFEALMARDAERVRDAMYVHIFNIKRAIDEVMKRRLLLDSGIPSEAAEK